MNLRALDDGLEVLAQALGEAEAPFTGSKKWTDTPPAGQKQADRAGPLVPDALVSTAKHAGGEPYLSADRAHAVVIFSSQEDAKKFVKSVGWRTGLGTLQNCRGPRGQTIVVTVDLGKGAR